MKVTDCILPASTQRPCASRTARYWRTCGANEKAVARASAGVGTWCSAASRSARFMAIRRRTSSINQGYPNLEYIIIDGGSTDGSLEIIKKYSNQLSYWISEPDGGMYEAIQKGFDKSTGEIMAWINSDDMYHPGALFVISDIFQSFPEVNWLLGAMTSYDEKGRTIGLERSKSFSKYDFYIGNFNYFR